MQKLCSCNVKMHTFHSKKNDNVDEELFSLVEDLVCFFVLFLFLIGKVDFICTVRMSNIHVTQSSQYYKRLPILLLGLTMKFTSFQNGDIRLSAIFFYPGQTLDINIFQRYTYCGLRRCMQALLFLHMFYVRMLASKNSYTIQYIIFFLSIFPVRNPESLNLIGC